MVSKKQQRRQRKERREKHGDRAGPKLLTVRFEVADELETVWCPQIPGSLKLEASLTDDAARLSRGAGPLSAQVALNGTSAVNVSILQHG